MSTISSTKFHHQALFLAYSQSQLPRFCHWLLPHFFFFIFKQNHPGQAIRKYAGALDITCANPPRGWLDQSKAGDPRRAEGLHVLLLFFFTQRTSRKARVCLPQPCTELTGFPHWGVSLLTLRHYTRLFESRCTGILSTVQKGPAHNQPTLISPTHSDVFNATISDV